MSSISQTLRTQFLFTVERMIQDNLELSDVEGCNDFVVVRGKPDDGKYAVTLDKIQKGEVSYYMCQK